MRVAEYNVVSAWTPTMNSGRVESVSTPDRARSPCYAIRRTHADTRQHSNQNALAMGLIAPAAKLRRTAQCRCRFVSFLPAV
jgi:hypothetical protein